MSGQQLYILFLLILSVVSVPELKLLHVLFMHKTYAPDQDIKYDMTNLPQNLSYEYFNSAAHSMPEVAQLHMYNLGVYLRQQYNKFLGDTYISETFKMRTTEYSLSIISAQLVNAGLWPPQKSQKWNKDLLWQPIPYDYMEVQKDILLFGTLCPNFRSEEKKVLKRKTIQDKILHNSPLFDYLSNHTKMKIIRTSEIEFLYNSLETKVAFDLPLPSWSDGIFPDGKMYNLTLFQYDLLSTTNLQKLLNGGTLLKDIIMNCLNYIQAKIPVERKTVMYSGDERNIVGVLKAMDAWSPHIPVDGTSLIFELYFDNDTKKYGIKVNYYTGINNENIPVMLQNCGEICPLDVFLNIVLHSIPINEKELCGWENNTFFGKNDISKNSCSNFLSYGTIGSDMRSARSD